MKIEQLDNIWQSAENQPSTEELNCLHARFAESIRRRDRRFAIFIGTVLIVLAGFTVMVLSNILGVGGPGRKIDLTREWALLPFLLLPWIGALLLLRRHRQAQRAHPDYEQTILATLRAARQRTLAAVTRTKTILVLQILSLPLGALCVWQLHAAGKVEDTEVTSLGTVLAGLILVSMACSFWTLVRRRNQGQRTAMILESYGGENR